LSKASPDSPGFPGFPRIGSGWKTSRAYQVHLISKGVSWASLNQVVCALRFFYGV